MKTSFLVEKVVGMSDTECVVDGAVIEGEISLGTEFMLCSQAVRLRSSSTQDRDGDDQPVAQPSSICLRVRKITAYRRELPILPSGMTGELVLEGNGGGHVQFGILLATG